MEALHDSLLPEASLHDGEKTKASIFRQLHPTAYLGKNQTKEERSLKTKTNKKQTKQTNKNNNKNNKNPNKTHTA